MTTEALKGGAVFDRVIVGIDGYDGGRDALALAGALRPQRLELVTAYPADFIRSRASLAGYTELLGEDAARTLKAAQLESGVPAEPHAVGDTSPARALQREARERDADLIVVGSCHRGTVGRVLLGDVSRGVLQDAPCSVAVAPHRFRATGGALARVAVAFDGSPEASEALHLGARLRDELGLRLIVVQAVGVFSVLDASPMLVDWKSVGPDERELAEDELDRAVSEVGDAETRVAIGDAGSVLTDMSEDVDLIVAGSRGWGLVRRVALGSASDRLVHHARCPVIVVPRPAIDAAHAQPAAAGGGVAALEVCLALRAFVGDDEVAVELLSPVARFELRPLSILQPFDGTPAWGMDLARFAEDQDVDIVRGTLARVDVEDRAVVTAAGDRLAYGHLLVAVGAEAVRAVPGAVTFRGGRDADAVRRTIKAVGRSGGTLAFAVPEGAFWTLPMYELALITASRAARASTLDVVVVSPEPTPLHAFGERASAAAQRLLDERGVRFAGGAGAVAADAGDLELADGRRIAADAVVALPRLRGPRIPGLVHDADGFLPVDEQLRVAGCDGVLAAGDVTDFPLKQGGLATQQADAAAETILADLGVPIVPRPFSPVLQGVLYTDREPAYLRAPSAAGGPEPRAFSLWWPPSKIAGRYLSPYLTIRAGAPRAPEVRPSADIIPVNVHVTHSVAGVRPLMGADAAPRS